MLIKKARFFTKFVFSTAFYGLVTDSQPGREKYLSKVGTGTVKNSYGYAKLQTGV
jgi:hypothetical protein